MRNKTVFAAVIAASFLLSANAQQGELPAACKPDARGSMNYAACADAAEPGSPVRAFALINLGTAAYLQGDYAEAVKRYDEAIPPGKTVMSDVYFHAFRGGAYAHVGRDAEAYKDARLALDMLNGKPGLPPEALLPKGGDAQPVYETILPILKKNGDPDLAAAITAYSALPADGWVGWSNRAAVLQELGDLPAAVKASNEAMKLKPDHPAVLNNHCYVLTQAGDAAGALPYCEKAVQLAPKQAAVRHSHASALAQAGRCREAEEALAQARTLDPSSATYKQPLACRPA